MGRRKRRNVDVMENSIGQSPVLNKLRGATQGDEELSATLKVRYQI